MEIIDVLREARALIAERGVARGGKYFDQSRRCFCSVGAIEAVAGLRDRETGMLFSAGRGGVQDVDAATAAVNVLRDRLSGTYDSWQNIFSWNDTSRDDAEVLRVFDDAITVLEAKHAAI